MKNLYDIEVEEMLARAGTFDLTGTTAKTGVKFFGFYASEGAVLSVIKGIPLKSAANTAAQITAAEVALESFFLTNLTDPLFGGVLYRVPGYIITNVKLTSGSLHLFKCDEQPAS